MQSIFIEPAFAYRNDLVTSQFDEFGKVADESCDASGVLVHFGRSRWVATDGTEDVGVRADEVECPFSLLVVEAAYGSYDPVYARSPGTIQHGVKVG
ncbi:unnamed protein product [Tilletia caries]|nr:unnamed protein product [Tilletia caries]